MGICEICGRVTELYDAIVEGAMVKVCSRCSKHGNVVSVQRPSIKKVEVESITKTFDYIEVIVDNYQELIKKGREKKGLNQEELAKAVAEKESIISQVEAGNMKPNFKLAKKLNVFLDIELLENVESSKNDYKPIDFKSSCLTIGDLLKKP
jgi:putative transcription factor